MTIAAILIRRQMPCCLNKVRPGDKELTHMAAFATTRNVLVTGKQKSRGTEGHSGIVADTAIFVCRDVISFLGGCDTRAMAGCAIVGVYAQVIKRDARESRKISGVMTGRTIQGRRQMIVGLANTHTIVMARRTVIDIYTHVSKRRGGKVDGVVARGAILVGGYVFRQLAKSDHVVMA